MPLKRTEVIQYKSDIQMHMYIPYIESVDRFPMPKTTEKRKTMKKKMRCCRCGRSSGCWFRDQQRSQDRKGLRARRGEERMVYRLPRWQQQQHGLGIKPTALELTRPKLSLPVGYLTPLSDSSLSCPGGEIGREGIIRCVRQYGLRVLSPGVSCARGRP